MEVKTREDALAIMGLGREAGKVTEADVQRAYRRLVKQVHPDVGGTDALFQMLNRAYEILTGDTVASERENPARGAGPENKSAKRRSFLSILADPCFRMPGKDFVKACCGAPQSVRFGDDTVRIGWTDILCNYVRCELDIKYGVKLYKSWFGYFFDRPYSETWRDSRIANDVPFSTRFKAHAIINTSTESPKYYRVYVNVPDATCGTFFEGPFAHGTVLTRAFRDKVCDKLSFDFRIVLS